ncbi:F-box/kelch-repeat protein At3g06240-like, partial [Salvia splendens]|uniref:F-box/kelch-repeat protein At3g06240-like n=1 Tax=Salvia splendens TaxID=180675 RepID=UPI001C27B30F
MAQSHRRGNFATSYTLTPWLAFVHWSLGYAVCDDPHRPLYRFDLPHSHNRIVIDSANGLLLLRDGCANILFICNPMTREYAELPPLPARSCFYGFGVSKLTGQYKILCANQFWSYCIYTIGQEEELWRSIAAPPCNTVHSDYAVFFNGNLHRLEYDFKKNLFVCCFDLDTELFTGFSLPNYGGNKFSNYRLCTLDGKLCFCHMLEKFDVVIWWMNNYGDENSWTREYNFSGMSYMYGFVYPLKILANGDLLFITDVYAKLFLYVKSTKPSEPIEWH